MESVKLEVRWAWLAGVSVLVGFLSLWLTAPWLGLPFSIASTLLWSSPLLAAVLASWLSSSYKFLVGVSMAPVAAVLVSLSNAAFQAAGRGVDFPKVQGGIWLFTIVLIAASIPASVGGWIGKLLSDPKHT